MKSPGSRNQRPWRWPLVVTLLLALSCGHAQADKALTLVLGDLNDAVYLSDLLTRVLEQDGFRVNVEYVSNLPNNRLERMLEKGDISVMMLGQTASREERFLPVDVGMTDKLIGQRILFIPEGHQYRYDGIENLQDIRDRQLTAGMGPNWLDYQIWTHNDLPVSALPGDWTRLFRMVAAGGRGIDYLPRGANEIAVESPRPGLVVEQNLALVYQKDHILYVSPQRRELYRILNRVLPEAEASGLIHQLVRQHYAEVYEPPVSLGDRRVIDLELPD